MLPSFQCSLPDCRITIKCYYIKPGGVGGWVRGYHLSYLLKPLLSLSLSLSLTHTHIHRKAFKKVFLSFYGDRNNNPFLMTPPTPSSHLVTKTLVQSLIIHALSGNCTTAADNVENEATQSSDFV